MAEAEAKTPQPVRLQDYRPPDYLVDQVELGFRLGDAATEVTARLALRRNPASCGSTARCWGATAIRSRMTI